MATFFLRRLGRRNCRTCFLYSGHRSRCSREPVGLPLVCSSSGRQVLDLLEAGIDPDGDGPFAGDFEAVVLGRVMGRRDLNAAAGPQVVDGEVHLGRVDHPQVDHPDAGGPNALDQGPCQRLAVRSHVPADTQGHRLRPPALIPLDQRRQKPCRGMPDLPRIFFVDLVGVYPPDVIRLENLWIHDTHSFWPSVRSMSIPPMSSKPRARCPRHVGPPEFTIRPSSETRRLFVH